MQIDGNRCRDDARSRRAYRGSSSSRPPRGLEGRRPGAAGDDARPAAPDPRLRGDGARARRRGPRPRPGPLQHRPGGRRGRLDRRAALDDAVNGSHRGHHQFLAKAITHVSRRHARPRPRSSRPTLQAVLQRTLAEILGLAQGYCRRTRRLDAPAVARGRRARHERHRRRRRADRRRQRLGAEALRHRPTSRSTTSATARARSARCSRR